MCTKSEFIERAKKNDGYQRLDEYLKQWLTNGKAVNRWSLNTLRDLVLHVWY